MSLIRIDRPAFEQRFLECARKHLPPEPASEPTESYQPSSQATSPPARLSLQGAITALNLASGLTGLPLVALTAQEAARELVTPAQEGQLADTRLRGYADRLTSDERVQQSWEKVSQLLPGAGSAPKVVDLSLVYAEADSREMYVGKQALQGDLASDEVLIFTLAHEEAHRRHRDSAGTAGLEALLEVAPGRESFQALRDGWHSNELQADLVGAEVAARAGCDPKPILAFLLSCPEDMQHPSGARRAEVVRERMAELGAVISEAELAALEDRMTALRPGEKGSV
ncbi:MAG: hypothetical protein AMXMBFR33_36870 [Candidatus Xenobia bacterium]